MKTLLILFLSLFTITAVFADDTTVFVGIADIKINESGISRHQEKLSNIEAFDFKCVISKIDDKYYWASRNNVELIPTESGAFITYVAVNGSGYIRIVKSDAKDLAEMMGETEKKYDYIEHLLLGLKTVTYYGNI